LLPGPLSPSKWQCFLSNKNLAKTFKNYFVKNQLEILTLSNFYYFYWIENIAI